MPIIVRDFKPEDFEILWRMDQQCFQPDIAYSKQELRAFMRQARVFTLVAVAGEAIQGFVVARSTTTGHIITIDVAPTVRRLGVGSLLLRAAEEKIAANGSRSVQLETAVDNDAALVFYKRHGYSVVRTWPRYYANGVDALVLQKRLADNKPASA